MIISVPRPVNFSASRPENVLLRDIYSHRFRDDGVVIDAYDTEAVLTAALGLHVAAEPAV